MQLTPLLNELRATVRTHADLAGADPVVEDAVEQLLDALEPAIRRLALDLAEQAAGEIGAQLDDHVVDVVLVDGDPHLRLGESPRSGRTADLGDDDLDARITLRLPPRLKQLVEEAADTAGASVNGYLVDVLASRARRPDGRQGGRVNQTFDL